MAQTGWFRGPICGVDNCRSRHYRTSDGLTICRFGHVMEGNIEIDDDQDQITVPTRRLNAVSLDSRGLLTSGGASQARVVKTNARVYGKEGKNLYYQVLQILLKRQLEIMMEEYFPESMHEDLLCLVKTNWIKVVSKFVDDKEGKDFNEDEDHEDEEDPEENGELRKTTSKRREQIGALDTVAIIYISALQLRYYPIYSTDILEGLRTNTIPCIRTLHLLPKTMLDKIMLVYHTHLQPLRLPMVGRWYERVTSNLSRIGALKPYITPPDKRGPVNSYNVPTNYYFTFIFRELSETLILPNSPNLFCTVVKLAEFIGYGAEMPIYFKNTQRWSPELQLGALILYVVKLNFTYGIFGRCVNAQVWLTQLEKFETDQEYSYTTSDNNELLDWSDDKINNYCDWIYDHIIPKKRKTYTPSPPVSASGEEHVLPKSAIPVGPPEELPVMEKRLLQLFNAGEDDLARSQTTERTPISERLNHAIAEMSKSIDEPFKRIGRSLELAVDAKLTNKLAHSLGVTEYQLERCYEDIKWTMKQKLGKKAK